MIRTNYVFLSTQEVSEKLHCSTHHVSSLRQFGLLRGTRIGRAWLYTEEDVQSFLDNVVGKDLANFRLMTPETAVKKYLNSD